MLKKQSNLKRLLGYAGRHRYLSYASWVLSAASALVALVPYVFIWRIMQAVLAAAPDFSRAQGLVRNGWLAVLFAGIAANKRVKETARRKDASGRTVKSNGRKKIHTVDALLIGITQCVAAVFPGLSRSGSTLSVGLLRGINQQTALDYSFVLGIPSIAAAALVSVFDMGDQAGAVGAAPLIAGVITSAVVGFLAIKLLKWIVTTNKLHIFAFYTLIVGALVVIIGIIEHITGNNLFTGLPL